MSCVHNGSAVRVFADQSLQLPDHGIAAVARDLGLRAGGVRHDLVVGQRGREGVDELEVAEVVEDRAAPFGQRALQVSAGLLEPTRGGRLDACGLVRDETADVAVGVGDRQPVARGCAGQHRLRVEPGACHQPAQVGDIRVQAGLGLRWRELFPGGVDQRVAAHRPVAAHHQHRQHGSLLGRTQRQWCAVDVHLQRPENAEVENHHR
jgi:hypothetical protein